VYTVTYNGNGNTGGSVPTDSTSYGTGIIVTVLGNPGTLVKTGSAFAGWNTAADGSGITYTQGNTFAMGSANVTLYAIWVAPINTATFTADGVTFKMVQVPAKTFPTSSPSCNNALVMPCNDAGTEDASAFWIGETEVTYELWNTVRTWATTSGGYNFQNLGAGSGQQPVTTVSWRDAMVWTNAATEWYNAKNATTYAPVYTYSGSTIKDSRDTNATACDAAVAGAGNGFRLLTSEEWELAARYKVDANGDGDIADPGEYYPGNYASGATAPYTNATATGLVAWYSGNSGGTTHDVKTRAANALGLYDMSGNVWEWCFDLNAPNPTRIYRGGSWVSGEAFVELGYIEPMSPATAENKTGFRIGRTE
jgi:formylglycine-generating enzyme required for sulfatase activity